MECLGSREEMGLESRREEVRCERERRGHGVRRGRETP